MTAKALFLRSHDLTSMDQTCTSRAVKRRAVRSDTWSGWSVGVDRGRLGADASRSAFIRGALHRHRKWTPFSEKKPTILASKSWRDRMRPKNRNRLALEVYQWCLYHRAPDKESLCCTYIMNAKMRLQMHNEDDFMYPIPPRLTNICRNNQTQAKSFEKIDSWACKLAIWHRLIPLFTFHMDTHTHMQTETSKQPPKIASTHAGYRTSENVAYRISLSRVWRSSHSQRGRRGEIIAYQEKWTGNEFEKNGGDCASRRAFQMSSYSNKNKL